MATAYFPTYPDDICTKEVGTETMPLRIINFQKYLQKCAINIPTNGEALGLIGTVLVKSDYKSVNNNQTWVSPTYPVTKKVLPTDSNEGASTRSSPEKYNEHVNCLLQHQHDAHQHGKKKMKYKKYKVGLTVISNLITTKIEESFVSAHNNSTTGFCLVDLIFLMEFIGTNYGTVFPKKLQENEIALDAQWDPNTTIVVLFNLIEDCKLFSKSVEEPLTERNILCSA